ncbi:LytTR family DNA-binding domain-containing protein [Floricoccus penangensis]|uniref:LytTR family DNA-binding domain-containing protein n=1 Tax=Floricoccus penangensis TaxID=1859475 RepID=UPI00203C2AA1|nr:LytTR family DNA-binding domain-containing protein [Floricoccus penangensis]URZ88186.1 LytTR family transcriptional regulator DNA-binding domain-containing protein [Floricoccus penangensis]
MKVNLYIDENEKDLRIDIYSDAMNEEIEEILKLQNLITNKNIVAYSDDKIFIFEPEEIVRIYSESRKVLIETLDSKIYKLKIPLYEVEEVFQEEFIRISKSELVNFFQLQQLEQAFNGQIKLTLKNGQTAYVSRRFVKELKRRLGI